MKKPWYQILLTSYVPWIATAFLLFGSILDAINNAIGLITPAVTAVGTALLILVFTIAKIQLRHSHILWITNDGQKIHIRSLELKYYFLLMGVLAALWLPRLINTNLSTPLAARSDVELILVTPEAGTQLSYTDLQSGVPISVVVETSIRPPFDWEKEGLIARLSLQTLRLRHEDGSTDWNGITRRAANSDVSRISLSGTLDPSAIYEGKITVEVKLAFFNKSTGKSTSGYDSRVLIEYPVSGAP